MNGSNWTDNLTCDNINDVMFLRGDWTTLPLIQACIFLLYILIFLTAFTGNCCVIFSVSKHKSLQTVRNVFIVGLSCSDLCAAFMSVLTTPVVGVVKEWHFGPPPVCHLLPLFQGTSLCFSTFTMACISIDRWILIKHPTSHTLRINKKQAVVMLCVAAVLAVTIASPSAYFYSIKRYPGICGSFCMEDWEGGPGKRLQQIYGLTLTFVTFFIPLGCVAFCYTSLGVALNERTEAKVQQGMATAHLASQYEVSQIVADSCASPAPSKKKVHKKTLSRDFLLPDEGGPRRYSEASVDSKGRVELSTKLSINNNHTISNGVAQNSDLADIMEEDNSSSNSTMRSLRVNSDGSRPRSESHGHRYGGKFRMFRSSLSSGGPDSSYRLGDEQTQTAAYSQREMALLKRQKRTNRMLISMVLIFAACWFLFVLMNFLRDTNSLPKFIRDQEGFFTLLVHCIAVSSTGWNPLLYAFMNEQFRAAFKQIFWMAPCCQKLVSRPRNYLLSRRTTTTMSLFSPSRKTTRLSTSAGKSSARILEPPTVLENGNKRGLQALVEMTSHIPIPEIDD